MKLEKINVDQFKCDVIALLRERWMLLTAGENRPGKFNMMTIGWAMIGVMWSKPAVMAVVRPSRHTFKFMESEKDFTLCAFPAKCREQLMFCGTKSGRDIDKARECGLKPVNSTVVSSPSYEEAELVLECRKIYRDEFKPAGFMADDIESNYNGKDYHRVYMGEIVAIRGTAGYRI